MTQTPDVITYSSVVTRETVCVAAADTMNANVVALSRERIRTVIGQKF